MIYAGLGQIRFGFFINDYLKGVEWDLSQEARNLISGLEVSI